MPYERASMRCDRIQMIACRYLHMGVYLMKRFLDVYSCVHSAVTSPLSVIRAKDLSTTRMALDMTICVIFD